MRLSVRRTHQQFPPARSYMDWAWQKLPLRGFSTACDLTSEETQAKKAPISMEERIIELTRENGSMRQEIAFFRGLADALQPLLPVIQYHVDELNSAIRLANDRIGEANAQWDAEVGTERPIGGI
ncbi:hypothetical protein ACCO45_009977 [Purpureocillium lilacinum]|uniref:Uncharacterized protein n=1 Tax=Purpureocillium lilacinum TaxID=33203 RepID=A0ACC4DEY8_PURLI